VVEPWEQFVVSSPAARTIARPPEHEVGVERGLRVPLRDGTRLGAMLWRPTTPGRYPVLVERGPHRLEWRTGPAGEYYAARGYAVLGVNLRGCGESEGDFRGPMPGAPPGDGSDTVEWAASQAWSNGRVGMLCGSVSGFTQYQTAVEAPPHLSALLVRQAGGFEVYRTFFRGGALGLAALQFVAADWARHRLEGMSADRRPLAERRVREFQAAIASAGQRWAEHPTDPRRRVALVAPTSLAERLPLAPHPFFAEIADFYNEVFAHPTPDAWWQEANLDRSADRVRVPICHLGGWFDGLVACTLEAFAAMRSRAFARDEQRLIIGPWPHGPEKIGVTRVGARALGPNAALDFFAFRGRWYDHYLQDRLTGVAADPLVWVYLIGPDVWLGAETWPLPGVAATPWYLRAGDGDGRLAAEPPPGSEDPDRYRYDANDPVPSVAGGGPFGMGVDQSPLESRLLTYTSPPLARPLALVGAVHAVLYAASSALDTDWVVKLTEVHPDGSSIVLSGGILRARYHAGFEHPALLEPDRPQRFQVELLPLAIVVPVGHRLRLTVTSSDFPAFDRNLNTGGPIGGEVAGQIATNAVFHDAAQPSRVVLPILG
jgi:putative CocE/NonD family hydrolase